MCNYTHLTDFPAGIDPNRPACSDGKLEGDEACVDGNTVSGDGCSAQCAVEYGHVCWGVPCVWSMDMFAGAFLVFVVHHAKRVIREQAVQLQVQETRALV